MIRELLLEPWLWLALLALGLGLHDAERRGRIALRPAPAALRAEADALERRGAAIARRVEAYQEQHPVAFRWQALERTALGLGGLLVLLAFVRRGGLAGGALGPGRPEGPWTLVDVGRLLALWAAFQPLEPLVLPSLPFAGAVGGALFHAATTLAMALALLALGRAHGPGLAAVGLGGGALRRGLATGAALYLVVWPLVEGATLLTEAALERAGETMPSHSFLGLILGGPPAARATVLALALAVAPLTEELGFRALLLPALRRHAPRWAAVALSALLFALIHDWRHAPPLFLLGLGLGVAYERTGSLAAPLALHMLFNGGEVLRGFLLARGAGV